MMNNYIECTFLEDDPETFEEFTLDQLLSDEIQEMASYVCDSEDGVWQYYYVYGSTGPGRFLNDNGYFFKIKKQTVLDYLNKRNI